MTTLATNNKLIDEPKGSRVGRLHVWGGRLFLESRLASRLHLTSPGCKFRTSGPCFQVILEVPRSSRVIIVHPVAKPPLGDLHQWDEQRDQRVISALCDITKGRGILLFFNQTNFLE